jgi:serine protease
MGTSMATPHMAGVLALMKSVNAALTPDDIDVMLIRNDIVVDIGSPGWDPFYGWGLIDAQLAVSAAIAAVGSPPADGPAMIVSPRFVHFGAYGTADSFDVSNASAGELIVSGVTVNPPAPWLSIQSDVVDANGVGSYAVTADRGGLSEGTYTTLATVNSNANNIDMQVTLIVPPAQLADTDAGQLYVVLVDSNTGVSAYGANVVDNAGVLEYTVSGVIEGSYEVIAGSDNNNDFVICDGGESCGAYMVIGSEIPVSVTDDVVNIDFTVSFDWFLPAQSSQSGELVDPPARGPVRRE